jgi:hypothetical protein
VLRGYSFLAATSLCLRFTTPQVINALLDTRHELACNDASPPMSIPEKQADSISIQSVV